MKKLYSLIIGAYIGPFFATFFIVLFILVMQFLWLYIDDLVGKGLESIVIAELLLYMSANLVPMALPLAILLSSIMTLGNLGENYELVALKSSGLSLIKILSPLIVIVILTALGAFYFANNIWPVTNLRSTSLLYDIRHKKPAIDLIPGVFYKGIEGYIIRVSEKDEQGDMLYDILIYDHTKRNGASKVIRAEKGKMVLSDDEMYLNLILYNGNSYDEVKDKEFKDATVPHIRFKFKEEIIRFDLSGFQFERTKDDLFKDNYQMLSINQLNSEVDTLEMEFSDRVLAQKKHSIAKYTIRKDSVILSEVIIPDTNSYHIDTLMNALQDKNKVTKIMNMAINLARAEKTRLNSSSRELAGRTDNIVRHKIEIHRKFTVAFTCIVLFFIGAPLGAIIRKGGFGLPVVIAVFGFLIFYMLNIVGEKMIKEGSWSVFEGMWLSSYALFPIALFLTYKANKDAVLFEGGIFSKLFNAIRSLMKRKKEINS